MKSEMTLQVVDFSPVITILHDFSDHFSPVRGLVSRQLGRKRGLFEAAGCQRTASPSGRAQGLHRI
jgi:hypothetical protein